ncbi:DoxX family protein [Pyxidicoccus sp. 3LFB2]
MKSKLFAVRSYPRGVDVVLLLLRLVCGSAMALHGWGKIQTPMSWMGPTANVPGVFQLLAAISEFGGGIAWVLGLLVPLASLGIACTMAVAVFTHAVVMGDPFVNMKGGGAYELAAVYFSVALLLMVASPGSLSADRKLFGVK